jgi:hypothetical protein
LVFLLSPWVYIDVRMNNNKADELFLANKEIALPNLQREKRAEELIIANYELKATEDDILKLNDELQRKVYSGSPCL